MSRPRIEILYFEGCPNHEPTRTLVERVAADLQIEAEIDLVEVPDADAASELRFLGSPTVRVNGRDVEPRATERDSFVFSCRVYRRDGGLSGQPDAGWVRDALAEAAAEGEATKAPPALAQGPARTASHQNTQSTRRAERRA